MKPESSDSFAVSVVAAPHIPSALVCLSGEIDMTASAALSAVANHLGTIAPVNVVIDLAEVTFACSTLPHFLVDLHHRLPAGSTILLCHPAPGPRRVLLATGMDQIATLYGDVPMVAHPPPT